MGERVGRQRVRGPDPERVGVLLLALDDLMLGDHRHVEVHGRRPHRALLGWRHLDLLDVVHHRAVTAGVERRQHREDDLAVLHRGHVPSRERAAVAVAGHLEHHRGLDDPRAQEVAVERVRSPVLGHGETGRHQRLRRHLPTEQRRSAGDHHRAQTPEEIAVELLEVEHLGEGLGRDRTGGRRRHGGHGLPCGRHGDQPGVRRPRRRPPRAPRRCRASVQACAPSPRGGRRAGPCARRGSR